MRPGTSRRASQERNAATLLRRGAAACFRASASGMRRALEPAATPSRRSGSGSARSCSARGPMPRAHSLAYAASSISLVMFLGAWLLKPLKRARGDVSAHDRPVGGTLFRLRLAPPPRSSSRPRPDARSPRLELSTVQVPRTYMAPFGASAPEWRSPKAVGSACGTFSSSPTPASSTRSKKKIAEHGGGAPDDTHVAFLISAHFASTWFIQPTDKTTSPAVLELRMVSPVSIRRSPGAPPCRETSSPR